MHDTGLRQGMPFQVALERLPTVAPSLAAPVDPLIDHFPRPVLIVADAPSVAADAVVSIVPFQLRLEDSPPLGCR